MSYILVKNISILLVVLLFVWNYSPVISQNSTLLSKRQFYLSVNQTLNNNSIYFSPDIFVEPCENNTTPYPCFNKVYIDTFLFISGDYHNFADTIMYFTSGSRDICEYVKTFSFGGGSISIDQMCEYYFCPRPSDDYAGSYLFWREDATRNGGFSDMYCKYCGYNNDTLRSRVWDPQACPFIRRDVEEKLMTSSQVSTTSICGTEAATPLSFPYRSNLYFDIPNLIMCYCEKQQRFGINCNIFENVDAKIYIDYIIFTLVYFLESCFAVFVLLIPSLLQIRFLKPIRTMSVRFNTYIRTLWTGSEDGALGYSDEQVYVPFKWFAIRHLRLGVTIILATALCAYTLVRIIVHSARPSSIFTVIDVFFTLMFFAMCVSFFLIVVLWSNIAFSNRRKGSADVLLMPLRVVLFTIGGFLLLIAVGWIIASQVDVEDTFASGIVLIVVIVIFIGIALSLFVFGSKLYYDVTRVKQEQKISFTSLKFTKFMFMANVTFLLTCIFFLLTAIQKITYTTIISQGLAVWLMLIVEFFLLCNVGLLLYILYDNRTVMDVYEFVYWPITTLCCCCCKKKE
ncbi:predicted protein [Naegleria gruberi]|uniref:Predicted protein n=1 Tax=Naegleria gruberi TaxID=5762 RepID=D2VK11_NAEGR|nr:uncharacterized protein NAEGRDRAFT_69231 [Naegleria gruberi]EFC42867.1 predicted protein [Naegleria gruberi]|eukprot:XP_002675611.1 predicted protein [Naegleria gruberi strain NEG-M]